jgi:hypothetical protein
MLAKWISYTDKNVLAVVIRELASYHCIASQIY